MASHQNSSWALWIKVLEKIIWHDTLDPSAQCQLNLIVPEVVGTSLEKMRFFKHNSGPLLASIQRRVSSGPVNFVLKKTVQV